MFIKSVGQGLCGVPLSLGSVLLNNRGDFLEFSVCTAHHVLSKGSSEHEKYFGFLLNCSALSSCVFSAPPPSESGRRWLRSRPQQQILCFQDCQQRQFLSLLYQWQESHVQRSGAFAAQPWHRPGPQQISDLAGTGEFSFLFSFYFVLGCSLCGCVCVFVSIPQSAI